ADAERRYRRLRAAGDHDIDVAVFDHAPGHADRVQAGRACRDDREVRPLEAEHDRDVPRDHVDDRGRHEERRDPARAAPLELRLGLLDEGQATDPRSDQATDALGLFLAQLVVGRQTGIADRLDRRGQAVVDERVHVPRILGREIVLDLDALDLAGNAAGEGGRVELRDVRDAGSTGEQVLPTDVDAVADRTDEPEP